MLSDYLLNMIIKKSSPILAMKYCLRHSHLHVIKSELHDIKFISHNCEKKSQNSRV